MEATEWDMDLIAISEQDESRNAPAADVVTHVVVPPRPSHEEG